MTLGCLQEHPRAGNRACHAPKRTDPVPWSFCEDDVGLPSRTSKGWKSSMPRAQTYRFRPLELFAGMALDCFQESRRDGNRVCLGLNRTDSVLWEVFTRVDPDRPKNFQGLKYRACHAPKRADSVPWSFLRRSLDCLQEHPKAGNLPCHAPKRTDSAAWSFLRG